MEGDTSTAGTDTGAPDPQDDRNLPNAVDVGDFSNNQVTETETETEVTGDETPPPNNASNRNETAGDSNIQEDEIESPDDTNEESAPNEVSHSETIANDSSSQEGETETLVINDNGSRSEQDGSNSGGADITPPASAPGAYSSSGAPVSKPDRTLRTSSEQDESKAGEAKVGAVPSDSIPSREERKMARMQARDSGEPKKLAGAIISELGKKTTDSGMYGLELEAELVEEVDHRAEIQKVVAEQTAAMRRELQAENARLRRSMKSENEEVVVETSNPGSTRKKIIIGLLVIVAGVVGVYFGTNGSQGSSKATEAPDTPPTPQRIYDAPSPGDCMSIANGEDVSGQDEMSLNGYLVTLQMIYSSGISFDSLSAAFGLKIQETMMPILAGCTDSVDDKTGGTAGGNRLLRDSLQTIQGIKEMASQRILNEDPNRYAIGNGRSFLPRVMDDEMCEDAPGVNETCSVVSLPLDLYLKDSSSVAFLSAISLLQDTFGGDLVSILDLQDTAIMELKLQQIDIRDQTQSPTAIPSARPTGVPSVIPSVAPSLNVSSAPSVAYSEIPSEVPSVAPSATPSRLPVPDTPEPSEVPAVTSPPTSGPTPALTPNPTPSSTPNPTPQPTRTSTPAPTRGPIPNPTPNPTTGPTPNPTLGATLDPTPGPTPNPTLGATLDPTPGPTPIPAPVPTESPFGKWERILAGHEPYHPEAFAWVSTVDTWEPDSGATNADEQCRERYAMAVLYYSFVSTDSVYETSWIRSDQHHCDWSSTRCDGSKTVDWMEIQGEPIGTFPTEIGILTQLTSLSLEKCRLTGTIPTEIGLLSRLALFNIFGNALSGTIPRTVGSMVQLTSLYLDGNELTGQIPTEVARIVGLQELFVADNNLGGSIPVEIGAMTQLTELQMWRNNIRGTIPEELGLLPLTGLDLSNNLLTGNIPELSETLLWCFLTFSFDDAPERNCFADTSNAGVCVVDSNCL